MFKKIIADLKARSIQLKKDVPAVFLALKAKETPLTANLLGGLTLVYAFSRIDLIPDFIPILGYLDDLIILPVLVSLTLMLIPPEVLQASRQQAESLWLNGKPKKMVLRYSICDHLVGDHWVWIQNGLAIFHTKMNSVGRFSQP